MKRWAELGSAAILPLICCAEKDTRRETEKCWRRCLAQLLKVNDLGLDTEDCWFLWHRRPVPRIMEREGFDCDMFIFRRLAVMKRKFVSHRLVRREGVESL